MLDSIIIDTQTAQESSHTGSIIWLHGLGADGSDFESIVPELDIDDLPLRFIFPNAPMRPVTVNGGYVMRAWYDIKAMTADRVINEDDLNTSVSEINLLVQKERDQGIQSDRIILAGFSQGGAVAYQTALNQSETLAGLLTMSTYIANYYALEYHPANKSIPILIQHGDFDPVVLPTQSEKAKQHLIGKGYAVTSQTYPTEHNLCLAQAKDIGKWLKERFC